MPACFTEKILRDGLLLAFFIAILLVGNAGVLHAFTLSEPATSSGFFIGEADENDNDVQLVSSLLNDGRTLELIEKIELDDVGLIAQTWTGIYFDVEFVPDGDKDAPYTYNLIFHDTFRDLLGFSDFASFDAWLESMTPPLVYYSVKASNGFGLYYLDIGNNSDSTIWSVQIEAMEHELSHISLWKAPTPVAPVPEPSTLILFGSGLAGLAILMCKRRSSQSR